MRAPFACRELVPSIAAAFPSSLALGRKRKKKGEVMIAQRAMVF
jgi:hypothetical protein